MQKKIYFLTIFTLYLNGKSVETSEISGGLVSCRNPQGKNLCAGLGSVDAAGNKQDLQWCIGNILHSVNNTFTNHIYATARNVFETPLDIPAIEHLYGMLNCIKNLVYEKGKKDKDLEKAINTLVNLAHDLINTTKVTYNSIFHKKGTIAPSTQQITNARTSLSNIILNIQNTQKELEKAPLKGGFFSLGRADADKEAIRKMLTNFGNIIEDCTKRALKDFEKELQLRKSLK